MQTQNRLFDDIARVASGAMGTLAGIKAEVETLVRHRMEALMADMDLVTREEFDAVKAMAAEARAQQETLADRLAALEAQLSAGKKSAPRTKSAPKAKKTKSLPPNS